MVAQGLPKVGPVQLTPRFPALGIWEPTRPLDLAENLHQDPEPGIWEPAAHRNLAHLRQVLAILGTQDPDLGT